MSTIYYGKETLTRDYFLERLVTHPPSVIAVDVETISLKERQPLGFSIATAPNESFYFNTYPENEPEVEVVKTLLLRPDIKKVFHNATFDLKALALLFDTDRSNIADTNVMARLLGRQFTKLVDLAPEIGRVAVPFNEMKISSMLEASNEERAKKCCNDSQVTLGLYEKFLPDIDKDYFSVEMAVIPILIDMSLRGLKVHQADRAALEAKTTAEMESYREMCAALDFNPGSPQQVGYILAKRGNFLKFTRSKKSLSTREGELEFLDDPLAAVVLGYRHAKHQLSHYLTPLAKEDRIYTEYSLDVSVGRVSSSRRNMQNIPVENRYIYVPDSGTFTTGDYSQEHLRILMHKSGDRELERVYLEGYMDGDIHSFTARELGLPRGLAKTINYAIAYGATPKTISEQAKIRDLKRCAGFLEQWFRLFRGAAEWIRGAQEEGVSSGWALPTLFNRRIKIPPVDEDGMKRRAVNYPILGSD